MGWIVENCEMTGRNFMSRTLNIWFVRASGMALALAWFHPIACRAADRSVQPIAVVRVDGGGGAERLTTERRFPDPAQNLALGATAFAALSHQHWLQGLVPVFAVERTNRFELRRRPPAGQENFVEPLFFALPVSDEPDAERVAGRWKCSGTREGIREARFEWELTMEGDQIAGRFDQNTDYRFASITGGSFRTNRFELQIQYINDRYLLKGEWQEGRMRGTWRRVDDTEGGAWEAERAALPAVRLPPGDSVPLYEWRRDGEPSRRYRLDGESAGEGWVRASRPLCRVWRVESPPAAAGK
jgi:hypothetical protein